MNWIDAAILGLVEGITEYLPISSTGHLILAAALLGLNDDAQQQSAVNSLTIVIQGGAILAVAGLYMHRVVQMLRGLVGRDPVGLRLVRNLLVAFVPAAVFGLLLDDLIEQHLFHAGPVLAALALGGVAMIAIDKTILKRRDRTGNATETHEEAVRTAAAQLDALTWQKALIIGLMQCIAMWPGSSRSMVTIVGGVLVGLRPRAAAEFSFLLGLPTLGAACVYRIAQDVTGEGPSMFEVLGWTPVIIGCAVAAVSAALAIRWLVAFLTRHGLSIFGWYRILLALVLGVLWWRGIIDIGS